MQAYFSIEERLRSDWLAQPVTQAAVSQLKEEMTSKLREAAGFSLAGKPDRASACAGQASGLEDAITILEFKMDKPDAKKSVGRLDPGAPRSTRPGRV